MKSMWKLFSCTIYTKRALLLAGLFFATHSAVAMHELEEEITLEQDIIQVGKASVSLVKIAGPGYVYLKTAGHEQHYSNAVWVSLGSVVLWREAKHIFNKVTGKSPVIAPCQFAADSKWKSWEGAANSTINVANKTIDVVGPTIISFLVNKAMDATHRGARVEVAH